VAEQNAFSRLNRFSLTFKTVVRVKAIDNPDIVVRSVRVHTALLVVTESSVGSGAMGHRSNSQFLFV